MLLHTAGVEVHGLGTQQKNTLQFRESSACFGMICINRSLVVHMICTVAELRCSHNDITGIS